MKNLDWDEPIPDEFRKEWIDFFRQLFQMEDIIFQRCIKPGEVMAILVLFSDGSENIFGTLLIKDGRLKVDPLSVL